MELEIIRTLLGISAGLIATLTIVIGWIGARIHSRLDSISRSLTAIERDLRGDLSDLDRRVVKLEVAAEMRDDE